MAGDEGRATPTRGTSRRERLRRRTAEEIKEHGLAQIAEGGTSALSLNGIGRAMGMSGPAVYRYFASRDALLQALVADGYAELTATVVAAADRVPDDPAARLRAVADAYRDWALRHPQRYAAMFGPRPAGYEDTAEAVAVLDGAMRALLEAIGSLAGSGTGTARAASDPLDDELRRWAASRGTFGTAVEDDPDVLRLGVVTWTRLHGIVGLDLAGILRDMALDGGRLVGVEVGDVVRDASEVRR